MQDCVFCEIVKKEKPASVVSENEHFIVFMNNMPLVEGHCLLVTKKHIATVFEIGKAERAALGEEIYRLSKILEKEYGPNIDIFNTSGKEASQSVFHLHFHFIPRVAGDCLWDGDKSRICLDGTSGFERLQTTKDELDRVAAELREVEKNLKI
ncbi:MAG: HIT family protein [Candidatus Pacebacteria bacterium]|nr:HIT family protein [Candidatus Paceibacterota bacterium]